MHRSPLVRRHLADRAVAEDSRVVHQDVEPAPFLADPLHHRLDGRRIAHVGGLDEGVAGALGVQLVAEGLGIPVDLALGQVRDG